MQASGGYQHGSDLRPGDQVKISGLQAHPEWNNQVGTLERFVVDKGRWEVRLPSMPASARPLGLKPANLECISSPAMPLRAGFLSEGLKDSRSKARGAVVVLCDNGNSGADLQKTLSCLTEGSFEEELRLAGVATCMFPCPKTATSQGEVHATDWFDPLAATSPTTPEDISGICESLETVDAAIDKIVSNGIVPERIGLLGHGAGGCLALHSAYGEGRYAGKLGAVACARGFLARDSILPQAASARFQRGATSAPPLFISHGDQDSSVEKSWALETHRVLQTAGLKQLLDVKSFAGAGHELCQEEIEQIMKFFIDCLVRK
eukprot:TRINITY_DN67978_c0_g1_i1.p1 TRINITY_DN67978_c0_g1~~TRINITY_DN67978_c0_g1_i1.p1  ORF type:complete len:320 (+),score=53.35 TRINITY_DN67978_c0_g1_i1:132-1091(+)